MAGLGSVEGRLSSILLLKWPRLFQALGPIGAVPQLALGDPARALSWHLCLVGPILELFPRCLEHL